MSPWQHQRKGVIQRILGIAWTPRRRAGKLGRGVGAMGHGMQTSRSVSQPLQATGPPPNGHTNRSTESCGTSVNLTAAAGMEAERYPSSPFNHRLNRRVVSRDCNPLIPEPQFRHYSVRRTSP